MPTIPGFWLGGPHDPLPVETTWNEFVQTVGGELVSALLPKSPSLENADYLLNSRSVVGELKEVETEFSKTAAFRRGLEKLHKKLLAENPRWRPLLFGGDGKYPDWFYVELVRIFRPAISRILKKANRQLRDTKRHFGVDSPTGVLFFVNDGFTSLEPNFVLALAANILENSYSSIDCFVYLTVNRYLEIRGSDVPRLVWSPTYSDRAEDSLVDFIDNLGRSWFKFIQIKTGPFTVMDGETPDREILWGSKAIVLPGD